VERIIGACKAYRWGLKCTCATSLGSARHPSSTAGTGDLADNARSEIDCLLCDQICDALCLELAACRRIVLSAGFGPTLDFPESGLAGRAVGLKAGNLGAGEQSKLAALSVLP